MTGQEADDDLQLVEAGSAYLDILAGMQAAAFEQAWGRDAFADLLALPGHTAWILSYNSEPLGYALLQLIGDEGELLSIAVLPGLKGQGLGKILLRKTLHQCSIRQINKIVLDVAADNDAAIGLYKSFGFNQVGLRKKYYNRDSQIRIDALVMVLDAKGCFLD